VAKYRHDTLDTPMTMNATPLDSPYASARYRHYVLFILTITYAFNFIDRQLISILQESIKQDLALSDTQLGLLTGFAFAVFYVTAGIPIARWSDHGNRRNIVSLAIGVWSFMTAISGACVNYTQMLLARIGVGIGESGGTPPAHSMLSDIYPEEQRATAISIYSLGINIGVMFGFLLGGILNEYLGWRWAFVILGLPGIILALIIKTTIKEPTRGWSDVTPSSHATYSLREVIKTITSNPVTRQFFLAAMIFSIGGYGVFNWLAPFFIRSHEIGTASLGMWLSLSIGLFGGIGTFLAGVLTDRFGKRNKGWYMWIPAIAAIGIVPLYLVIFTTQNTSLALWLNFIPSMMLAIYIGPGIAVLHTNVKPTMRATASALFYFVVNIIGLGLGPTIIGGVSDYLTPSYGQDALRMAMLVIIPSALAWSAIHFYLAGNALAKHASKPC
jgi:predicted MFS family arabinose efflux permease